ncbi:MAG: P-loop NTPase fold protein [Candidatus Sumerlaeia bacterium]|nr:P-loop NTPase fold protein [Candidatus Sumerlaeia bacterium]
MRTETDKSLIESLKIFINNPDSKVAMLNGDWGIGKTYFWRELFVRTHKHTISKAGYSKYIYVSIFDKPDLKTLKKECFVNLVDIKEAHEKKSWKAISSNLMLLVKEIKVPLFGSVQIPYDLIHAYLFSYIQNALVVIDDLERKPDSLSMELLLGFVSELREEHNCKVVIIYNDEQMLNENNKKTLNKYKEKVVDYTFGYNPSLDSRISIVFNKDEHHEAKEVIRDMVVTNVRVIKKIKNNISLLRRLLKHDWNLLEDSLHRRIERQLAYITIFSNDGTKKVKVEKLSSHSDFHKLAGSIGGKEDTELMEESKIIGAYRYDHTIDPMLIELVTIANFVKYDGLKILGEQNELEKKSKMETEVRTIWNLYNGNFSVSTEEFIAQTTKFLKDNCEDIPLNSLLTLIATLDELGGLTSKEQSINWIEQHAKKNSGKYNPATLSELLKLVKDDSIVQAIKSEIKTKTKSTTIGEEIKGIVLTSGWSLDTFAFLDSKTEKEYLEWIENDTHPDLLLILRDFLYLFRSKNDPQQASVINKIEYSLDELARKSKINEYRINNIVYSKSPRHKDPDQEQ